MLLLTRKIGEQILIGNGQIKIKLLAVNNLDMVLGIKAPEGINIEPKNIVLIENGIQEVEITSQIGQEILLNQGLIKIKLLFIGVGKVIVGIQAPSNIDVDRREIFLVKRAKAKKNLVTQSN